MENSVAVVILAAGKGSRMGGKGAKVLVETSEGPLIAPVLRTACSLNPAQVTVVVGFEREAVEQRVRAWWEENPSVTSGELHFAVQEEQRGTGDAVQAAVPSLEGFVGEVVILCGDAPLISERSLTRLLETHRQEQATASVLTAILPEPGSYGRILRDPATGQIQAIREAKDASPMEFLCHEINSGVYVVDSAFLPGALQHLRADNAQSEYYLTDIFQRATEEGQGVASAFAERAEEVCGVNTFADLHLIERYQRLSRCEHLAATGVRFTDSSSVYIHHTAEIAEGVSLGPNTVIGENVVLHHGVTVEGLCHISNSTVGANTTIKWGVKISGAEIGEAAAVGPFAHLREKTSLGDEVKVGNFVEIKKSSLAAGSKASHLSYLGDAVVEKEVNIGAGTITCNYDGEKKFTTTIKEGAFIGSNSALVAPVTIGEGAVVGAGSTISKDVTPNALALTRAPQREIPNWRERKKR